ncbi:hypothetical protein Scep_001525 [Stephania cephalantha]|uniref:Uncharacterized protein n=1 Tax=Stephania cephalantha TaxID=152367 RepID=A0AAP0LC60_9MAGN
MFRNVSPRRCSTSFTTPLPLAARRRCLTEARRRRFLCCPASSLCHRTLAADSALLLERCYCCLPLLVAGLAVCPSTQFCVATVPSPPLLQRRACAVVVASRLSRSPQPTEPPVVRVANRLPLIHRAPLLVLGVAELAPSAVALSPPSSSGPPTPS